MEEPNGSGSLLPYPALHVPGASFPNPLSLEISGQLSVFLGIFFPFCQLLSPAGTPGLMDLGKGQSPLAFGVHQLPGDSLGMVPTWWLPARCCWGPVGHFCFCTCCGETCGLVTRLPPLPRDRGILRHSPSLRLHPSCTPLGLRVPKSPWLAAPLTPLCVSGGSRGARPQQWLCRAPPARGPASPGAGEDARGHAEGPGCPLGGCGHGLPVPALRHRPGCHPQDHGHL